MKNDGNSDPPKTGDKIDTALREHLEAIAREETPERLLVLARELQRLLRDTSD